MQETRTTKFDSSLSTGNLRENKWSGFPSWRLFWGLSFIYASFLAVMLQTLILPLLPDLHAGHGLLKNDAILFHELASKLAERIHESGWSEWKLYHGAGNNVGMLAAVYAVLGPDPVWFIPFNAAAHATGALLIYRLGSVLWPGKAGLLGGLIAGIAFLVFPSALQWYGQNHKDAFSIVGILLVLYAWLRLLQSSNQSTKELGILLAQASLGAVIVAIVRPYFPVVIVGALFVSFVSTALIQSIRKNQRSPVTSLSKQLLLLLAVSTVAVVSSQQPLSTGIYSSQISADFTTPENSNWEWKESKGIPVVLDEVLERASQIRAHAIAYGKFVGARSGVDVDVLPTNASSAIEYMPRALVIGLLTPFPDTWTERVTLPRLVGAVETAIWYVVAFGLIVTCRRAQPATLVAALVFCAVLLTVVAYVHPNVGTLYRQRFGIWFIVFLCGSLGWANTILGFFSAQKRVNERDKVETSGPWSSKNRDSAGSNLEQVTASGAIVIIITLLSYIGFLARDLLLFNQLGLQGKLDAFFAAAVVPIFFVTFLSMPLSDVMMKPFVAAGNDLRNALVRNVLAFASLMLGMVAILLALFSKEIVSFIIKDGDADTLTEAAVLLTWFEPVLFFSAWTIVGNTVLNAMGRSKAAANAQLLVPIVVIITLVMVKKDMITHAAAITMSIGTFLNALIVVHLVKKESVVLLPTISIKLEILRPILKHYIHIMFAAMFVALLVPVNYIFAATVGDGAISGWALISKIVILFSGLASVGMSAVVMPHLARLLSGGRIRGLHDDTAFFLIIGTWISALIVVLALIFDAPFLSVVFSGSLTQDQTEELVNILAVGVLQIPLAISSAILMKVAVISDASNRMFVASFLGLIVNIVLAYLLVPGLGLIGVAAGSLSGVLVSTATIAILVRKEAGLSTNQLMALFSSWLVLGGLVLTAFSESSAVFTVMLMVMLVLAWVQYKVLSNSGKGFSRMQSESI